MTAWVTTDAMMGWIGSDKLDTDTAAQLASDATDAIMQYIGRDLALTTTAIAYYDTNGTDYVLLDDWPVRSLGTVTLNGQAVAPAAPNAPGYLLDRMNKRKLVFHGMGKQARGVMNVTITNLITGYDLAQPVGSATGLPGPVSRAILLTGAAMFNAQAADPNLASESTAGVFSGSFYKSGVGAIPPGAVNLLANEVRVAP